MGYLAGGTSGILVQYAEHPDRYWILDSYSFEVIAYLDYDGQNGIRIHGYNGHRMVGYINADYIRD